MSVIHNVHDKFFKSSMSNLQVAREFFQHHLPDTIRAYIDLNTLELQSGSYIDKALQQSASDILYQVQLSEKSGPAYL